VSTLITALVVGIAAAAGATARYVLDQYVRYRRPGAFPLGTWVINISGSFALGLLVGVSTGHGAPEQVARILGTGFCGAYTTFSTFSYETILLSKKGQAGKAVLYCLSSLVAGLSAGAAGLAVGAL
jgi:fluoride exporter